MQVIRLIFVLLLAGQSFASWALTFSLSEQDVNQMVRLAFPQSQQYQGVSWTFSEPQLQLGNDRQMAITVTLSAVQGGKSFKARGTFSGLLAYQGSLKQLQIEQPTLEDYTILANELAQGQSLSSVLDGLKGQPLPMILLVDFTRMNIGLLGNQLPKHIDIQQQKLIIEI